MPKKCRWCDSTDVVHVEANVWYCKECGKHFDVQVLSSRPGRIELKSKDEMEIIPEIKEAIGFYRGWAMARGMDQKLQTNIEVIVQHALQSEKGETFDQLKRIVGVRDATITTQKKMIKQFSDTIGQLQKEKNEKTWLPEDTDAEEGQMLKRTANGTWLPVQDIDPQLVRDRNPDPTAPGLPVVNDAGDIEVLKSIPSEKDNDQTEWERRVGEKQAEYDLKSMNLAKTPTTKKRVLEALRTKTPHPDLRPKMHEIKPYCYRCTNLTEGVSGAYPLCKLYGVGIRAWQSERQCAGFDRQKSGMLTRTPLFRCSSCNNYSKDGKWCSPLNFYVKNASENKLSLIHI